MDDEYDNEEENEGQDEEDTEEGGEEDSLIQEILEDDDYESEDEDEEEGEDDDDDEEDEGEGEDEEDEDEEGEEEDEELTDLITKFEEQEEDDGTDRSDDPHKITDEQIAAAVYMSPTYEGWVDSAHNEGVTIDDTFAAMVGKTGADPKMMVEQSIYSMKDLVRYTEALRNNQDPDRLVVPDSDDPEEWRAFLHEGFNVPKEPEGYSDDIFAHSFLDAEDMTESREKFKQFFHDNMFSEEQAVAFIDTYHLDRQQWLDRTEKEEMDYRHDQEAMLRKSFGGDYETVMKELAMSLRKFGPEFKEEFTGSKVMNSHSFALFVQRLMSDTISPQSLRLKQAKTAIQSLSQDGLNKAYEAFMGRQRELEEYSGYKGSKNPREKKLYNRYKKNNMKLNDVMNEINRRGLQYTP